MARRVVDAQVERNLLTRKRRGEGPESDVIQRPEANQRLEYGLRAEGAAESESFRQTVKLLLSVDRDQKVFVAVEVELTRVMHTFFEVRFESGDARCSPLKEIESSGCFI